MLTCATTCGNVKNERGSECKVIITKLVQQTWLETAVGSCVRSKINLFGDCSLNSNYPQKPLNDLSE